MRPRSLAWRRISDLAIKGVSAVSAVITLFFLAWIIYEVVKRGMSSYDLDFFTKLPTPPGVAGGGLANAILGTLLITLLATVLGVPLGILAGVYLSEFGLDSRAATAVRFVSNVLMGMPSIIIGVFVYTSSSSPAATSPAMPGPRPWPSSCSRWWPAPPRTCWPWSPMPCASRPWPWARPAGG